MSDLNDKLGSITNTADRTAQFDPQDVQKNKAMGVLAYLSWLIIIPLLAAKDSKFARFHCNQGLVLAIAETLCWIVVKIFGGIPVIGWVLRVAVGLLDLAFLVLAVMGIVNAASGKAKELPLLGSFRLLS
ncbi:MAG: hypothetical protein IJM85_00685 [Clostridia bacterium]|jgi:uncharacterized membrane protein|nr:hypothetical protein [Clostridia bacterium]MCR4772083.1 hypothetical protein [Oscillospiraceae bacterium]